MVKTVLSGLAALAVSAGAPAADITYNFSTGAALDHGGTNDTNAATRAASQTIANSLASAFSSSTVSGSFVYDASSPLTNPGGALNGLADIYSGSSHSSFNALSGLVSGSSAGTFSFSDPRGFTLVGNDASPGACMPVPPATSCTPPLVDLFQFQAESTSASIGVHNIVPFTISVGGSNYTLFNARVFWQESLIAPIVPDFLTSNALLATPPSFSGRLSLDFVNAASPAGTQYFVFYDGTNVVAAVPEPQTGALLAAGMGLLGFIARRKKRPA
ncbi:MAG TPA: PEP-CTERM sorting domain-containing protein [Burkholderiales bacterium]|nr:PEP-CTERM sorting domain-containing protein [Burkholderiales bacterium]